MLEPNDGCKHSEELASRRHCDKGECRKGADEEEDEELARSRHEAKLKDLGENRGILDDKSHRLLAVSPNQQGDTEQQQCPHIGVVHHLMRAALVPCEDLLLSGADKAVHEERRKGEHEPNGLDTLLLSSLLGCLEECEGNDSESDHQDPEVGSKRVLLAAPEDRDGHDRYHLARLDDDLGWVVDEEEGAVAKEHGEDVTEANLHVHGPQGVVHALPLCQSLPPSCGLRGKHASDAGKGSPNDALNRLKEEHRTNLLEGLSIVL
mmetsp:Transcript_47400/g.118585  ORF Transcript_47400/g.118585 Transcript_47400/m.118585 type:complete len:264 (-) Transcript_47400:454-1245(-)